MEPKLAAGLDGRERYSTARRFAGFAMPKVCANASDHAFHIRIPVNIGRAKEEKTI